jgi:hypothetical protein
MPFSAEEIGKGAVSGEARRRSVAAHHAEHDDNFQLMRKIIRSTAVNKTNFNRRAAKGCRLS